MAVLVLRTCWRRSRGPLQNTACLPFCCRLHVSVHRLLKRQQKFILLNLSSSVSTHHYHSESVLHNSSLLCWRPAPLL